MDLHLLLLLYYNVYKILGDIMGLFSVFLTGVGLSMDACAVSFAKGVSLKSNVKLYAFVLAIFLVVFRCLCHF